MLEQLRKLFFVLICALIILMIFYYGKQLIIPKTNEEVIYRISDSTDYVVSLPEKSTRNMEKVKSFYNNLKTGNKDSIILISYDEKKLLNYRAIFFDGKSFQYYETIKYKGDITNISSICSGFNEKNNNGRTDLFLTGCDNTLTERLILWFNNNGAEGL